MRTILTDYGHPERAFFQKFEIFGLGQTNWAENLWGIWAISGQTISTILALWVPYPWESVAGPLSYKKLWFLGLKHITPKCSQNKIWAVQNLENSVRTSVFGDLHICHLCILHYSLWLLAGNLRQLELLAGKNRGIGAILRHSPVQPM